MHVASRSSGDKDAIGHIEPIAIAVALDIGLDAQMGSQVVEETDVEVGHTVGQLFQELHRLLNVAEQVFIALGLLMTWARSSLMNRQIAFFIGSL